MSLVAAGFLDQRITIQTLTVVRGALGGHDETWSPLAAVWAQMMDMTGREIFQAKAMGSAATVLITIRYRSDVRASQRILFTDGSIARIEWIRHVTRKERLELYCLRLDD
ncbi:MAG: phage head closure protein [Ferrovum sp.]|jgi:SPP1 family predicted phage head-tail adaptor|nr:phage head closure protein [Ferrovum sp.]